MTDKHRLPKHVRAIHDAIARHDSLLVLADGTGDVYFKGYCRGRTESNEHFIRVHHNLLPDGRGPNSGCLLIRSADRLGADMAAKVHQHLSPVYVPVGKEHAAFRDDVNLAEIVAAIKNFGDAL